MYQRPPHTKVYYLPKRGRQEFSRVEGFTSKEEAEQYANWYYQSHWGYGPSTRVTQHEDGTWNVDISQWDSCD